MSFKEALVQLTRRDFLVGSGAGIAATRLTEWGMSLPKHHISFAQCGEDLVADTIFACMKDKEKPTYLDIGAAHPTFDNNTYLFYHKGARGVLVEPNPNFCEMIRKERKRDTVLMAGIGVTSSSQSDYYVMNDPTWNTFSKEEAERYASATKGMIFIKEIIPMPLININTVIAEHFGSAPDFLSIDVQGWEFDILKSLDLTRFKPPVICIETVIAGSMKIDPAIEQYMTSQGYVARGGSVVNTIFVDGDRLES